VITLCNAADADAADLAHRVADIFLDSQLKPLAIPSSGPGPVKIQIDPALLDTYVGYYQFGPGSILGITREEDQLFAQLTGEPKIPVLPSSNTSFSLKVADVQLTFDGPTGSGESGGVTLHQAGRDHYARRIESAHLTPERILAYTGTFYSDELDTLYSVSSRDGKLFVRYARGESEMKPAVTDMFEVGSPFGTVNYQCSAENHCDTFTVTSGRVRRLRFNRVDLTPTIRERSAK